MATLNCRILMLTGWTADEIDRLVHNRTCPDHWNADHIPTFALMETIRNAVDIGDTLSYRKDFIPILKCLGLKEPKLALSGLLSKIKRYAAKAEKTGDLISLCLEMTDLTGNKRNIIGPACEALGLTPQWFHTVEDTMHLEITNQIIAELYQYRKRHSIEWKIVISDWWPKLFPEKSAYDGIPPMGTIISSWEAVDSRKQLLSRNASKEEKELFLNSLYTLPSPKTVKHQEDLPDSPEAEAELTLDDSGYETADSNDEICPYLMRRHSDTIAILHELLEKEKIEKAELKQKLTETEAKRCAVHEKVMIAENAKREREVAIKQMTKEHEKDCSKYKSELAKARKLSEELEKKICSLDKSNVVRRLVTRDNQLAKERETNSKLKKEIEKLHELVKEIRRVKRNKTEQIRYNVIKRTDAEKKLDVENVTLKNKLKDLEIENDLLRSKLDEIMGDKDISAFEDGAFTTDIRVVCYELMARGVSSKHVSDIIRLVLKRVAGLDCGRLPKPTCIRYMAFEQALLSKHVAMNAITNSITPVTLQTDGTSKKHRSYVTMLASTDTGTVGLGMGEVLTETAETLLQEAISTMTELLSLEDIQGNDNIEKKATELLMKVKNTMTDRCVVNKKFVKLLQDLREKVLPSVVDNWNNLSQELKTEMTTINDLYCGKHLVLNFQEYAGAALSAWEEVESGGRKLGREMHIPWSRKSESATLLAVRSVCEAFGPDAHAQAGCPQEFATFTNKNLLKAYRGNRFNIPFENAGATYFHHINDHFTRVRQTLPPTKQSNNLIKSVMWDLEDKIILGGIRAMGIIGVHLSTPLMQMVECTGHVMDTDILYTRLHDCVREQMEDPQQLLDDNFLLFPEFPPAQSEVHRSLYKETDEDVDFYTKQAIIIILHNIYVCIQRQLEDHLPGGKHHKVSTSVRQETTSCPKDNIAAERMFAGLDFLKRNRPNMTTLAMQGILLWTLNKSMHYLDNCGNDERARLIKAATKERRSIVKQYQDKVKNIKMQRQEKMERQQQAREEKIRKQVASTIIATENIHKFCGGPCTSGPEVDDLLAKTSPNKHKQAVLSQLEYYKTVNRGLVKGSLFFKTKGGVQISIKDLCENLKEVITTVHKLPESQPDVQPTTSHEKELGRKELREKFLGKLNPTKRKLPFPESSIVKKRIRHKFLSEGGKRLVSYTGTVLRKSTERDIEEYIEEDDKKYLQKGYTFYTIMYDKEEELCTYPLQKEWNENFIDLL